MAKMVKKFGIGKSLAVLSLAAVLIAGAATFAMAAEDNIYKENQELKTLLKAFGKGNVDIYASLEDLRDGKTSMANVKMMRPITVFDKPFYRAKDNKGNIILISPAKIAAVKVSAANF
ncbi:MAG: hypothetical protein ACYTFY_02740 [Planctomycetota bacterium]|jgi:hypothetical protein